MLYDRDVGYGRAREEYGTGEPMRGRGEYGEPYERPYVPYEAPYRAGFHGYGMGYLGGSLRSRGSFEAGQIRSGLNPYDEFEFEWGDGYVGGRGYGGTNYDFEHGYQPGVPRWPGGRGTPRADQAGGPRAEPAAPAGRWETPGPEAMRPAARLHGPARYGYGPYHDRLRRHRRDDDEIREDVDETLFYDTWVDADAITVDVEDGVVTLHGALPNYDEVRYATDDAWDVDGVRGVRTELMVERTPATERLGRRREFSAGEIATENEPAAPAAETPGAAPEGEPREREPTGSEPTGREPTGPTAEEEGGTA